MPADINGLPSSGLSSRDGLTTLAPRLFAIVDTSNRENRVIAWGMELGDNVEVVTVDRGQRFGLGSAETARSLLSIGLGEQAHLVWVPAPAHCCTSGDLGLDDHRRDRSDSDSLPRD